jgi:hypothetical protein
LNYWILELYHGKIASLEIIHMHFIKTISEFGLFIGVGYITFFYHSPISYWVMKSILGFSERTARVNAGTEFVAVVTFFVLLMAVLVLYRILILLFNTFIKPSIRPSLGLVIFVPPINSSLTPATVFFMLAAIISACYLLTL